MERTILHCDLNSYFASVEIMLNPELKGKAVAVCGKTEDRHGIVLAKSDLAKSYGVSTGEAIWQAKQKCPFLTVVEPHYEQYAKYSRFARIVYSRYTDIIEPFGIDEAWLDMTPSMRLFGKSGYEIAQEIRQTIKRELGLTISVGVSFNKVFAKLGSDMKKPDAVTVISKDSFREQIYQLDASEMLGIGRSTKRSLNNLGIYTIGDLAQTKCEFLQRRFGVNGLRMWRYANGMDNSAVDPENRTGMIKSVGHGTTAVRDIADMNDVRCVVFDLSQDVSHRLRKYGLCAKSVQISVRDCELNVKQFQCELDVPTQNFFEIAEKSVEMFVRMYDFSKPIRSITVRAIDLSNLYQPIQLSFDNDFGRHIKLDKIENAIEEIRDRYGNRAVNICSLLTNDLTARNGKKTAVPCSFNFIAEEF